MLNIETVLKSVGMIWGASKWVKGWIERRKNKLNEIELFVIGRLRFGPGNCLKPAPGSPLFFLCERMANLGRLARVMGDEYMLPEFDNANRGGSTYSPASTYDLDSSYDL
jgi:hypothetical protein